MDLLNPIPAGSERSGYGEPHPYRSRRRKPTRSVDENGNAYALNLTSRRVGRALTLLDGVRQGQDLPALLGYQFERGLHAARLDRLIDKFRTAFPLSAPDDNDPNKPAEIVPPRNVCDGRELVNAVAASFAEHKDIDKAINALKADDQKTVRGLLTDLDDATDAVGDVLLFEGIFQAVQGNYERSGAALDACAGLGPPPDTESVTTPIDDPKLRHRVCIMLPSVIPTDAHTPGVRAAAEPHLNAWVGDILGPLPDIGCRVYAETVMEQPNVADGLDVPESDLNPPTSPFDVRLSDLEPPISPLDFLYMCSTLPTGKGNSEIEIRVKRYVRGHWPPSGSATFRVALDEAPEPVDPSRDTRSLEQAMELGRTILEVRGNASALTPAGLMHPDDAPGATDTTNTQAPPIFYSEEAVAASGAAPKRLVTSSADWLRY